MIFNVGVSAPIRPVMSFNIDGTTYYYNGTSDLNIAGKIKIQNSGTRYWKMWIYDTATVDVGFLRDFDICLIGHGGKGGNGRNGGQRDSAGGGGGGGGAIVTQLNYTGLTSGIYTFNIGDSTSIVNSNSQTILSAATGSNGTNGYNTGNPDNPYVCQGGNGGATGGSTSGGQRGGGQVYYPGTDSYNSRYGTNGSGLDYNVGVLAFGDVSFDGIKYAQGGGGGLYWWAGGAHGSTANTAGSGGGGGGHYSTGGSDGQKGIILLRSRTA